MLVTGPTATINIASLLRRLSWASCFGKRERENEAGGLNTMIEHSGQTTASSKMFQHPNLT